MIVCIKVINNIFNKVDLRRTNLITYYFFFVVGYQQFVLEKYFIFHDEDFLRDI